MVKEIATATAEQSTGVAAVGSAIGELDDSTQRNAALAEESAAAAHSLERQARTLMDAVSIFRLNGNAARISPPCARLSAEGGLSGRP